MSDTTYTKAQKGEAGFGDYFALLKPRVMSLVIFTAFVGMIVAPGSLHPVEGFAAILFIALGAGASGALNMWYDADIDQVMRRTKGRPVPSGKVTAEEALAVGLALSGISVVMLGLATNVFAGLFLAFTIFFYAVVYTMWLKRSTPQNIVIGGAAGAFPPMIGWAAVTGSVSLEAAAMFALIFFWTPPHFWALALFMRSDYDDANVPMLTVTHGRKATRQHIFWYTLVLAAVSGATALTDLGGPTFVLAAIGLNIWMIVGAWRIIQRDEVASEADDFLAERKFFKASLWFLFIVFLAFLVDAGLAAMGAI